jgi:DNA-binding transcriptional ArsR family regulator
MPRLFHPSLEAVSLEAALHALSDPVRLAMVARLAQAERLNCAGTGACPLIPKSTVSHHLAVLRSAGLIETVSAGREKVNTLRRSDFEARFPGLLAAVLANRDPPAAGLAPAGGSA